MTEPMHCSCGKDYQIPSAWTSFLCAVCGVTWTRKLDAAGYRIWRAEKGESLSENEAKAC